MLTIVYKKLPATLLLCSLCVPLWASSTPVHVESISDALKKTLEDQQRKDEEVQRSIAMDMKQFLGLINLKDIETQNVMRLLTPPFYDTTVTIGERIKTAEESLDPWQLSLVEDTVNYNMHTPEDQSSDIGFLAPRMEQGANAMLDPSLGYLDDLLASTLLKGYAFEDDKQAEQAYKFIQYITNFKPIQAMTAEEIFADPNSSQLTFKGDKEKNYLMALYKQLPSMTMAQNSLLAIHAEKQRFAGFAKDLEIGDPDTQSASLMEVMAYEVERRYMSEDWHNAMNQMSTEGLLKEIANILAFQSYISFKNYERGQRVEAMIASQMGTVAGMLNQAPPPSTEEMMEGL